VEERQREAQRADERKRLKLERAKTEAQKQGVAEKRKAAEAARAAEIDRLMTLQKDCFEERAKRL